MKSMLAIAFLSTVAIGAPAVAKGTAPEDLLKGKIIFSDKPLPMRWNSAGAYVSQLRGMNKGTLWYDKKTKKLTIEYAAFFAQALNDVQVNLVIYDITNGARDHKSSTENFMNRGDRVLFNRVEFNEEDFPMNRKYMFAIENRHVVIASGSFIVRGEAEQYSGKVTFDEEEAKKKE